MGSQSNRAGGEGGVCGKEQRKSSVQKKSSSCRFLTYCGERAEIYREAWIRRKSGVLIYVRLIQSVGVEMQACRDNLSGKWKRQPTLWVCNVGYQEPHAGTGSQPNI